MITPKQVNKLLKNLVCPKCYSTDVSYVLYGHYGLMGEEYWKTHCKVIFGGGQEKKHKGKFSCNKCFCLWG